MTTADEATLEPTRGATSRHALCGLGLVVVFLVSLVGGVVTHLNLPPGRRAAATLVRRLLREALAGEISFESIDALGPRALRISTIRVREPGGQEVLYADHLDVVGPGYAGLLRLARATPTLTLPNVAIDSADLDLALDESKTLGLARALAERPGPPGPPRPPRPRRLSLVLENVTVGSARVRGPLSATARLDAELRDVLLQVSVLPTAVHLELARATVDERGLVPALLTATTHGSLTIAPADDPSAPPRVGGAFKVDASFGSLPVRIEGRMRDGEIVVDATAPEVGTSALRALTAPALLAPTTPLALRARMRGSSKDVDVALHVDLPPPSVTGPPPTVSETGSLDLAARYARDTAVVKFDAAARSVDIGTIAPSLGRSRLTASATAELDLAREEAHGSLAVRDAQLVRPDGVTMSLPKASGTFRANRARADTTVRLDEPGTPTDAWLRWAADQAAGFALHTVLPALGRVPRLDAIAPKLTSLRGDVDLTVTGTYHRERLDASMKTRIRGFAAPSASVSLARADLNAHVTGTLDALTVDASGEARNVDVRGQAISKLSVTARGPVLTPRIKAVATLDDERTVEASGVLAAARRALDDVRVDFARAGKVLNAHARTLALVASGGVNVDAFELGGSALGGTLSGDLRVAGGELDGQLEGRGIDAEALGAWLGAEVPTGGTIDVDVDVRRTGKGTRVGYAEVALHDGRAAFLEGVDAEVSVDFEGRHVAPHAELRWRDPAHAARCARGPFAAQASGDLDLHGALLDPDSWKRGTGAVALDQATVDLDCVVPLLAAFVPTDALPFGSLGGQVELAAAAERRNADDSLAVSSATVVTRGFRLAPKPDDQGKVAWRTDQLDARASLSADVATGAIAIDATVLGHSRRDLATARVRTTIDPAWLSAPPSAATLALGLATKPFVAEFDVPSLDSKAREALPFPLRDALADVGGTLSVTGTLGGTPLAPEGAVRAHVVGLDTSRVLEKAGLPPLDVEVLGTMRDGALRVGAWASSPALNERTRPLATFDVAYQKPQTKLFGPKKRPRVDATARLDALPLGLAAGLRQRGISGAVTGTLAFHDDGEQPTIDVHLAGSDVRLGSSALDDVRVDIGPAPGGTAGALAGDLRVLVRDGGNLHVNGIGALRWEERTPSLDPNRPFALALEAREFSLAPLLALMPPSVTRIDGRLDGRASAAFGRRNESDVSLTAALTLHDGKLQIPELGQDLTRIEGTITARPGLVTVDGLRAATPTGHVQGRLDARLAGFRLIDFTGQLSVPEGDEIPIALEGQSIGTVRGVVTLRGERRDEGRLDIDLTAADLRLRLPPSPSLSNNRGAPQTLDAHPDVVVLQPLGPPVSTTETPSYLAVNLVLRNATVEGSALKLVLSTDPERPIRAAGPNDLTGELVFTSGYLKLMGKTFELDRGIVRLRPEEPSNPYVNMTAHWSAPDGTVVFVDYVGTIKPLTREKLRFRSNPPRSEDAILGLFVFGDTYDLSGSVATDAQRRANQALAGVLAAEVNQLFGDVLPGLSAGIGATTQGYTATTVSYQFSDRLSAQATLESAPGNGPLGVLGPSSGSSGATTNPGVTAGDSRAKFGIDWRFADRWLVRGALGVTGGASSGVDLLYQRRY